MIRHGRQDFKLHIPWRCSPQEKSPPVHRLHTYRSSTVKRSLQGLPFVGSLVFNGTFSKNMLYGAIGVWNILCRAGKQDKHTIKQWNKTLNQISHKRSSAWALWRQSPSMIRRRQKSLSSQSLGKYWKLNENNQETEHIQTQTNHTQKVALINSKTLKNLR